MCMRGVASSEQRVTPEPSIRVTDKILINNIVTSQLLTRAEPVRSCVGKEAKPLLTCLLDMESG